MIELTQVKPNTIASQARQALEDYIIGNKLAAGTRLPTDRELAVTLNCSRTAVREALKSMEAVGLIEMKVGRGIFVSELGLSDVLEHFYPMLVRDTDDDGKALTEARLVVEAGVIAHATERATDDEIADLREMVERHKKSPSLAQTSEDDIEFHGELARIADSPVLADFSGLLKRFFALDLEKEIAAYPPDQIVEFTRIQVADNARQHTEIVEALASRDRETARKAIREHIMDPGPRSRVSSYE